MSQEAERVHELEERVEELEATVRGLTEELVDASERIRALEEELDQSPSTEELREGREDATVGDEATKGAADESGDNEEADQDDIIVA